MNKMLRLHLLTLVFVFCKMSPAFAATPMELDQKQARWAFQQLRTFLQACIFSDQCPLTDEEREITLRIARNDSYYSDNTLVFKSEKLEPNFFQSSLGENHRIMMTGDAPNTPIYINEDRLAGLSLENLFGLLAHELVHHLGIKDDARRIPDQYGVKILNHLRPKLVQVPLAEGRAQIAVLSFPQFIFAEARQHFPQGLHPRIFVRTPNKMSVTTTDVIRNQNDEFCPNMQMWSSAAVLNSADKPVTENGVIKNNITFAMTARCFDSATTNLQEVKFFMTNKIDLVASTLEISQAQFNFSKFTDSLEAEQTLEATNIILPTTICPGEVLTIKADMTTRFPYQYDRCAMALGSPEWLEKESRSPFSVANKSCRILSEKDGTYTIEATFEVPAKAPNGLQVTPVLLGMQKVGGSGYNIAVPAKKSFTQVVSSYTNTLQLKSYRFTDFDGAKVFVAEILGAKAPVLDGSFRLDGVNLKNQLLAVTTRPEVVAASQNELAFKLPFDNFKGNSFSRFDLFYLSFVDSNWNYFFVDLKPFSLSVQAR